jgi:hypothetical protein
VPKGKRPQGTPRQRWVDNIKFDLVEAGRGGVHWICLAQDMENWRAPVNVVRNLQVL